MHEAVAGGGQGADNRPYNMTIFRIRRITSIKLIKIDAFYHFPRKPWLAGKVRWRALRSRKPREEKNISRVMSSEQAAATTGYDKGARFADGARIRALGRRRSRREDSIMFMPISIRFSHSTRTPAHMVRFATTIVNGTGFGASEVADVSFDAANVARATTGPTGSFTGTVPTVPERTTPGTRWITAGGQHACRRRRPVSSHRRTGRSFHRGPQRHGDNGKENVLKLTSLAPRRVSHERIATPGE